MHTLITLIKSTAITLLLIIAACLLLLSLSPRSLIALTPYLTPYQVTLKTLDIHWLTPQVKATQIEIRTSENNTDNTLLAEIDSISLASTWKKLWGNNHYILGEIRDGVIHADRLIAYQERQSTEKDTQDANKATPPSTQKIHELLRMLNVNIYNINVNIEKNKHLSIKQLEKSDLQNKALQGLVFSLVYQDNNHLLPITGTLTSQIKEHQPHLSINIPALDIRTFTAPNNHTKTKDDNSINNILNNEAPIDWQWVTPLTPLNVYFSSDIIQMHQGTLTEIDSTVTFNTTNNAPIMTQRHSGLLEWTVDEELSQEKNISLSFAANSRWKLLEKITTGADISGETSIRINDETIEANGTMNLNGFSGQDFTLHTSANTLPSIVNTLAPPLLSPELKQQISPLFPFSISSQLTTESTQKNQHIIQLKNIALIAGESDLNGNIAINLNSEPTKNHSVILASTQFGLHAKKIVLPTSTVIQKSNDDQEKTENNDAAIQKIFNDKPINIDGLNTINTSGNLSIDTIVQNNIITAEGIDVSLSIKDKTLQLKTAIKQFAKGSIDAEVLLDNTVEPPTLSTRGTVKGLLLESLSVLPKDEFKGGKTNIDFSLTSKGLSTQAIANQLQGSFLLESTEGTIANNSFELIGSDLILNLINTINPFHKKAKNTQLECAVVKANITEGKIHFDHSIAIRTSKMAVVADGTIDLTTEKMNLGINPKARSGVGVDVASLAKFVAMKGYLSRPSLGVSASGTLKSALNIGAAISTGGLSLIASGLVDKAITGDICQTAKNAFSKESE